MKTLERKQTGRKASTTTVTLRIPAKASRALEYHGVTPEKFIKDVWAAVGTNGCIIDAVETLYPAIGKRGYVQGLVMIGGE